MNPFPHAPVYLNILAGLVAYVLLVAALCWLPQMRERRRRGVLPAWRDWMTYLRRCGVEGHTPRSPRG